MDGLWLLIIILPMRIREHWTVLGVTLFTNSDSPVEARVDYMPSSSIWVRRICWWGRNPFHDFTFYVIGFANKEVRTIYGTGDVTQTLQEGFHWAIRRPKGWPVLLPYISLQKTRGSSRYLAYIGWRPQGAFGLKMRVQHLQ